MSGAIYYERDEDGSVKIEVEDDTAFQAMRVWKAIYDLTEGNDE